MFVKDTVVNLGPAATLNKQQQLACDDLKFCENITKMKSEVSS